VIPFVRGYAAIRVIFGIPVALLLIGNQGFEHLYLSACRTTLCLRKLGWLLILGRARGFVFGAAGLVCSRSAPVLTPYLCLRLAVNVEPGRRSGIVAEVHDPAVVCLYNPCAVLNVLLGMIDCSNHGQFSACVAGGDYVASLAWLFLGKSFVGGPAASYWRWLSGGSIVGLVADIRSGPFIYSKANVFLYPSTPIAA